MDLNFIIQHSRKTILLLAIGLALLGIFCFGHLPVAIFPDLAAPRIIVTADAGDAPISNVLPNVTLPLESAISSVPGVTTLKSLTVPGSDELDVNFAWGTNMDSSIQQVNARIAELLPQLPQGTSVQAEKLNPSVFPVMGYSLYSPTVTQLDLRHLALYNLRPKLLHVPGVQQVTVMGGDAPEYLVSVSPSLLIASGVSIGDVETALSKANEVSSVGYYDESYLHHDILVNGLFRSADDINNVTIAVKNNVPITVGQIATVTSSIEPHTIETSGDGHPAVLVDIIKQPNANTIDVADGVSAEMATFKSSLPPNVTISNYYDQSQIVRESQASVLEAILTGGILALVVLMLFLGNLRAAVIVLLILPLTIVITFVLMRLLGQTLNIMTLGALAIALGLVIDDGIVVVENIFHELERGKSRPDAIAAGLKAISPAMIGSSLTTMVAFLPLTFLVDLTGQFFAPLAIVMIATLGISLILSLLLAPLLAGYLLPLRAERGSADRNGGLSRLVEVFPELLDRLSAAYGRGLTYALHHRTKVTVLLIPLALVGVVVGMKLKTGFFPDFDEGGFILDYQLPDGTSLAESSAIANRIEQVLSRTPEIAAWSRRTGAQLGFDITTQNVGDMSIRLTEHRSRSIDEVMDSVRSQVNGQYPQAQADFHQILQDNIGDIAGSPSPVEVKIFGPDQSELETLAGLVDSTIVNVPGVVDDFDGVIHTGPQTVVDVNSSAAQRYGLTTDDVAQEATAALLGTEPTHIQQGEEAVGVRVMLNHSSIGSGLNALTNLPIAAQTSGVTLKLSQVAAITLRPGDSQITRENQRQMISVTADLSNRDLGSATTEIRRRIDQDIHLPAGYSIEYGGQFASQQQSFGELSGVLGAAALSVFTLLVFLFRSYKQAFSVLAAALISLFGVVAALLITGTPLNISSFTGAIMIVGIITENGIVLFSFFNQLRHENPAERIDILMVQAGTQRLRPILMTTIGAILALLPLALGIGAGAALQKPLAIAVIGGLSVSVIFTLFIAPVLYLTLERKR